MTILDERPLHSIFCLEPKREIQAVIFDMDGVLADSVPIHIMSWAAAFEENNLPGLDQSTYLSCIGRTNKYLINQLMQFHHITLTLPAQKAIIESKERLFRDAIKKHVKTTPGVMNWLDFFQKKRIHCSVASSGDMANIAVILETLHISDYFTSILSGSHLAASKPNPLIFALAAASLGVSCEKCMVIEDAPAGIQAAKSANMICCAIATTLPAGRLQQADILLDNLAQFDPQALFSDH
jgi:HAD superfamily hydrolase (TIGR01509 family)